MVKVGLRKPSLKKSISARTKGRVTRAVRKALIPGYGQKGMGWAHPNRKLYNEMYQRTTVDTRKVIVDAIASPNSEAKVAAQNYKFKNSKPQTTDVNQQVSDSTKKSTVFIVNQQIDEPVKFFKTVKGLNRAKVVREVAGWSIWVSILFQEPGILIFLFIVIWVVLRILTSRRLLQR